MLTLSTAQREREERHAREPELQTASWQRSVRGMFLQSILLTFLGVPLYAYAWHLADPARAQMVGAAAFLVSYVGPLIRMLVFHLRATARGDY